MELREEGVMESPMLERHAAAETLWRGRERKNAGFFLQLSQIYKAMSLAEVDTSEGRVQESAPLAVSWSRQGKLEWLL